MEKNKVAVIGAGLMGNGIAQACAAARYEVVNAMISMCIGGGQGISMYFTKCQ